jgi:formate dehydrogenase alpha subunit
MVNQAIKPIGKAKTDGEIICDLATRMGYPFEYQSSEEVMQEIAKLTPIFAGITHARLGTQGLQWPVPHAEHPGTKFLHEGKFNRGKGQFVAIDNQLPAELPDEKYPFLLNTGRKLSHYNVFTLHLWNTIRQKSWQRSIRRMLNGSVSKRVKSSRCPPVAVS